jgi:hypothetical protein
MQILGEGKDIHEQMRKSIGQEPPEESHDFFKSISPQDPHTKRPTPKFIAPKFNFKIIYLAGYGHTPEMEVSYIDIMNKIVSGVYTNSTEETYHDKDGNLKVLLRWCEWPDGGNPNQPPKDEEFDRVVSETDKEKSKKEKKEKKKAGKAESEAERASSDEPSPASDPQVNF